MKIKFSETRTVEAQGKIVQTFNAGEVHELSAASARRWIRRGVAMEVRGKAAPKSRPKPKPVPEKKGVEQSDKSTSKKPGPLESSSKPSE